jgi:predicted HAD superfamily Cof-like phosphohydrolase
MEKLNVLNQVADFHRTFKHPLPVDPAIPSKDRCQLRISLLKEELSELEDAIQAGDLVAVADAFCDLQYVLSGAILEFGLGAKFKDLFDEVQRSNMSKSCATLEEAEQTQVHYKLTKGVESVVELSEDHYLVYRADDRKTLKSIHYSPADLTSILFEK